MSPKLRHQESSRKERHLERKMQADDAAMEEDSQLPVSEALEVKRSNIEKSLDKVSILTLTKLVLTLKTQAIKVKSVWARHSNFFYVRIRVILHSPGWFQVHYIQITKPVIFLILFIYSNAFDTTFILFIFFRAYASSLRIKRFHPCQRRSRWGRERHRKEAHNRQCQVS